MRKLRKGLAAGSLLLGVHLAAAAADVATFHNRRELFVDDAIIETATGVEYRLGVPRVAGTALRLDRPWEGRWGAYLTIVSDGTWYQMYYRGGFGASRNQDLTCYAESPDGITWERPALGLHEFNGSRENNIVMPMGEPTWATHNFSVFYDGRPGVPREERYKAVGGGMGSSAQLKASGVIRGLYRFASADGKTWRPLPLEPLFTGYALDSQNVLTWLPAEQCYAIYLRTWTGDRKGERLAYNSIRTIARSTSKDFITWSEPVRMVFDQGPVEDLYTNATQPYFRAPHILIALPFRFVRDRRVLDEATLKRFEIDPSMWKGASDAILMTSRGGTHYQRKFMESFVRPGIDPSSWAARSNMPAHGIIQTGPTELSFFIVRGYSSNQARIERLALRLDGFASLHAGYDAGFAVTRPMQVDGRRISLNLSTSAIGSAKVVLLDEAGKEIRGFGEADARELVGDAIDLSAAWSGAPPLEQLKGRTVRIKFLLRDADLYSFAVTDD